MALVGVGVLVSSTSLLRCGLATIHSVISKATCMPCHHMKSVLRGLSRTSLTGVGAGAFFAPPPQIISRGALRRSNARRVLLCVCIRYAGLLFDPDAHLSVCSVFFLFRSTSADRFPNAFAAGFERLKESVVGRAGHLQSKKETFVNISSVLKRAA